MPSVQNTKRIQNWIQWYNNSFKNNYYYHELSRTTEGSKFHRESSVAIHTDMVVMNILRLEGLDAKLTTEFSRITGLFAAAFHDVGKSSSMQAKHSDERGDYLSFAGHEQRSARLWEDFYMQGPEATGITEELFGSDYVDNTAFMFAVGYMIEHHRPWGLKDTNKIDGMLLTLNSMGVIQDYFRLLIADNLGRITDDQQNLVESLKKVDVFESKYNELMKVYFPPEPKEESTLGLLSYILADKMGSLPPKVIERKLPSVIIPIAPSGAGKSTLFKKLIAESSEEILHHSMDDIRIETYGDDYAEAFERSKNDSNFASIVQADFIKKIKTGKSIYIDNTNLSRKRRRFYVDQANRNDYNVVAYLIPTTIKTLLERQKSRPDKFVPYKSVMQQYVSLSLPTLGLEFDEIIITDEIIN